MTEGGSQWPAPGRAHAPKVGDDFSCFVTESRAGNSQQQQKTSREKSKLSPSARGRAMRGSSINKLLSGSNARYMDTTAVRF